MSKKPSLLNSRPPLTIQLMIYSAAGIVIVLGLITLTSVDKIVDGWYMSSAQELSK